MFQLLFLQSIFSFQKTIRTTAPLVSASSYTPSQNKNNTVLGIKTSNTPSLTPLPTFTPTPTPVPIGDPVRITIPTLGIESSIVNIGVTDDNIMDTPVDFMTVGWFTGSVKPGMDGVSILTGHYDDIFGKPAIFYQLAQLQSNDTIIITTDTGQEITFTVESSLKDSYKTFPKDLIYSHFEGRILRLITCNGIWDTQMKTYSKRLVITAKQIN